MGIESSQTQPYIGGRLSLFGTVPVDALRLSVDTPRAGEPTATTRQTGLRKKETCQESRTISRPPKGRRIPQSGAVFEATAERFRSQRNVTAPLRVALQRTEFVFREFGSPDERLLEPEATN